MGDRADQCSAERGCCSATALIDLDARHHDFSNGDHASVREVARDLVKALRPVSQDLGCEAELEGVLEIAVRGTGAESQRAVFEERGSPEDVAGYLVATTA